MGFPGIPPKLEKIHLVPPSALDEALARYSISREVPRSILKCETVLGTLDATPKCFPWCFMLITASVF